MDFIHRYSDSINNSRVVIIGPYPPPLGGISVHIERVMHKLQQQNNQVFHFHNDRLYKFRWLRFLPFKLVTYLLYFLYFFFWLLYKYPAYVVYHTMYSKLALVELGIINCVQLICGFKVIVVDHNARHIYMRGKIWKYIFNYYAQLIHVIPIGDVTYKTYKAGGIQLHDYSIESPFLPPNVNAENSILATYPQELVSFLQQHVPIIGMNASRIVLWQHKDLYGIDQAIEMLNIMCKTYPQIGMVIAIAQIGDEYHFHKILKQIQMYDLIDHIFILSGNRELWPLLKMVDVFVRPTCADTFGISVAESLWLGTPAIASNVCTRPEGTILYQQGDVDDLVQRIDAVLKEKGFGEIKQQCDHMHTQQTR